GVNLSPPPPGTGSPGHTISFCFSFGVNLRCGNGDIAFHFNPRFNEGRPVVVCNTQQNGCWGAEERTYHLPFQQGIYFEVIINVKGHCYQVSVNGQHFLEYRHRLPLHTVQILEIKGDVTVNCINFTSPSVSICSGLVSTSSTAQAGSPVARDVVLTDLSTVPGFDTGLVPLSSVHHPGTFLPAPFFQINLKNSMTGNIALHINPRLRERALVRNTQTHGTWGSEERHLSTLPFAPGQAFQVSLKGGCLRHALEHVLSFMLQLGCCAVGNQAQRESTEPQAPVERNPSETFHAETASGPTKYFPIFLSPLGALPLAECENLRFTHFGVVQTQKQSRSVVCFLRGKCLRIRDWLSLEHEVFYPCQNCC
uniref:Galectin n=1 Tax=Terrapene triunguis TaxID=2587831 RepID=A0A674IKH2_9SAUR